MRYFDFNQLNPITKYFTGSSYEDQLYSFNHWFNFRVLAERQDRLEEFLLLIPLTALLFVWYKMFAWYDKT